MGKGKRHRKPEEQKAADSLRDNFYEMMKESFQRKIDECTLSGNQLITSQPITSGSRSSMDNETLRIKEIELKNKEIELLKKENELIKAQSATYAHPSPAMPQFSFKDVEDSLTKFNGTDSYTVEKWISDVDEASNCLKWTDEQKVVYAKRLLVGSAKTSLRFASKVDTWDSLKAFLSSEFEKTYNSAEIHKKLADRRKTQNETFDDYLICLREMAKLDNVEDAAVMVHCINGINDIEVNKSILYGASTIAEFKIKLSHYSEMRDKMGRSKSVVNSVSDSTSKQERGAKTVCFNCGGKGHISKHCRSRDKGPKCYKCQNFGHVSTNCGKSKPNSDHDQQHEPKKALVTKTEGYVNYGDLKQIEINGCQLYALVDSGSDLNIITKSKFYSLGHDIEIHSFKDTFKGVGKEKQTTMGFFVAHVTIDGESYQTNIHVVDDELLPVECIIGKELMKQTITVITPEETRMLKYGPVEMLCLTVERGTVDLKIGVVDKPKTFAIKKMVANYKPNKVIHNDEIKMKILLVDDIPIFQRPRRLAPLESEIVRKQTDDWLKEGVIRQSKSNYASPIVLTMKKDGSRRLCVDYRLLNKKIIKDRYPMPLIDDQIDQLKDAKLFSTLDLKNGFFHIPIDDDSIKYTSFVTPFGQFEFLKVPFGLCNSPAVFQRYINNVFKDLVDEKIVCVYMDDVIIPAGDDEEALARLSRVIKLAEVNGLVIKWEKCQFLSPQVEYLGYEIANGEIKPSKAKIEAVKSFPEPNSYKAVQRFLGLTGYFRKFIAGYSIIAKPLSDLLRKDTPFKFGELQRSVVAELKEQMTTKPVLKIYSQTAETQLHTDASKIGLGAVLLQCDSEDQKLHPVYYYSKKTSPAEERYSSYELGVLAVVTALKKLRVYLLGLKFCIVTDCSAFKSTMEKRDLIPRISGWALYLQEFDYQLEHRSSTRMKHVDALSRGPIVLTIEDDLIKKVKAAQKTDEQIKTILKLLESGAYLNYITNHGILFKECGGQQLLVVPRAMQPEVIKMCHDQGHFAVKKTNELIQRQFFLPDAEEKIKKIVRNCIPCILAERKMGKQDGLLNPIPKGDAPLITLYVDHLGHLTPTKKLYKYILSVIDGFTKFVWLYPVKTTNAKEVVQKLKLQSAVFGNPKYIVSDKGGAFISNEFKEYCQDEDIVSFTSTPGVSTGTGQVERLNRIIIPALAKLSRDEPENWFKYVEKVQRFLNNSYQRSIGRSPFELLTGIKMRCPEELKVREAIDEEVAQLFEEDRWQMRQDAIVKLSAIQEENKRTYNKRRKPAPKYNVGEHVLIKRTQFNPSAKLKDKFLGPYEIVRVKDHDRYDVKKIGDSEGPNITSTSAENIKRGYCGWSDDEPDDSD